jgi:hypothetical protein
MPKNNIVNTLTSFIHPAKNAFRKMGHQRLRKIRILKCWDFHYLKRLFIPIAKSRESIHTVEGFHAPSGACQLSMRRLLKKSTCFTGKKSVRYSQDIKDCHRASFSLMLNLNCVLGIMFMASKKYGVCIMYTWKIMCKKGLFSRQKKWGFWSQFRIPTNKPPHPITSSVCSFQLPCENHP